MTLHHKLDKLKLIQQIELEYAFAQRTLDAVSSDKWHIGGVCGHWSIQDVVAHLTSWEQRTLRWLTDAENGQALTIPEAGFTWNDYDALNDLYYQRNKDRTLDDVLADFHRTQQTLLAQIHSYSENALFGGDTMVGMFVDSPADAIVANTYSHYEFHFSQVREWLNRKG